MRGAWTMAKTTFREAARKRFLWMGLLAGLAFLTLFGTGLHFQIRDLKRHANPLFERGVLDSMLMMGLYAADLLAVVMTILICVDTLSGEISSGTIQAVVTKPIPRWAVILGKWLGFAGMVTLFLSLMVGGVTAMTEAMGGVEPRHWLRGFCLIWLECLLLLSLVFLLGTLVSTLTNGVIALGMHGMAFMGGWIEQAGALTHSPRTVEAGIIASLIMPSEALWRRAAFEMQSPLVGALRVSPFSNASVPSMAMVLYGVTYLAAVFALSIWRFQRRDL